MTSQFCQLLECLGFNERVKRRRTDGTQFSDDDQLMLGIHSEYREVGWVAQKARNTNPMLFRQRHLCCLDLRVDGARERKNKSKSFSSHLMAEEYPTGKEQVRRWGIPVEAYASLGCERFELYESRVAVTMIGFPLAERPDVVNAVRRAWNAKVVRGLVSITFVRYGNVGPEVIPTGQDKVMVGIPQTMDVTSIEEFLRMGGACTIRDLLSRYEQKLQMRRALSEQNTHSASPILQKRIPVFLEVSDVHQHSVCFPEYFVYNMGSVNCMNERLAHMRFTPVTREGTECLLVLLNICLTLADTTEHPQPMAKRLRSYSDDAIVLPPLDTRTLSPKPGGKVLWRGEAIKMFVPRIAQREGFNTPIDADGVQIYLSITPARQLNGEEVFVCTSLLISFSQDSHVRRVITEINTRSP
jgi:hypothetical protein